MKKRFLTKLKTYSIKTWPLKKTRLGEGGKSSSEVHGNSGGAAEMHNVNRTFSNKNNFII